MTLVLDATPKGVSANSYATLTEADAYFEGRMDAANWAGATETQKTLALVAATARLEQEHYIGVLTDSAQRLKWPRRWVPREDVGDYYDAEVIPRPVKEAMYEVALAFRDTAGLLTDTGLEPYDEVEIGPLRVVPHQPVTSGALPSQAKRLLAAFATNMTGTVRLLRT